MPIQIERELIDAIADGFLLQNEGDLVQKSADTNPNIA